MKKIGELPFFGYRLIVMQEYTWLWDHNKYWLYIKNIENVTIYFKAANNIRRCIQYAMEWKNKNLS